MDESQKPFENQPTFSFQPGAADQPAAAESEIPTTVGAAEITPATTDFETRSNTSSNQFPGIAGYAITAEIARGGMGRVYAAMDLVLQRRVAIKTLLPSAAPDRFINESKITASLSHPGIPPVHALGTLDDGSPFLAMKLIQGRTLDALLKERTDPTQDLPHLIQIFEQIAQAVGFAHSQGIIHRDLKPLNVMVGAFGEVQVMDWGLAKIQQQSDAASDRDLANVDHEAMTAHGAIMGTPGFMAPEQARGEAVDARADVFALGATLAMILTGRPAFIEATARDSLARAARGDVSEVLQRLDRAAVDHELKRIASCCLVPDLNDRPVDAKQVAQMISDYRDGVEQRLRVAEMSATEARVRELELRKRKPLWLGLTATLFTGTLVSLLLALWANSARRAETQAKIRAQRLQIRAEDGETLAENRLLLVEQEKLNTDRQRRIAEVVRDFLQNKLLALADTGKQADALLRAGESSEFAHPNPTIRELLDRTLIELSPERISANFPNEPEIQAELLFTAGNAYLSVGGFEIAIGLLSRSAELRSQVLGLDHIATHAALNNLGNAYREAGKFQQALQILEPLFESKIAKFGADSQNSLSTLQNLALTHLDLGDAVKAVELFQQAKTISDSDVEPEVTADLTLLRNLASAYHEAGNLTEAISILQQVLEKEKELFGPEHPKVFNSLNNLASVHQTAGDRDLALQLFNEAIEGQKAKLGPDHPDTLVTQNNLALAHFHMGSSTEAKRLFEELAAIQLTTLAPDHPATLTTQNNLANVKRVLGELSDAKQMLETVYRARSRVLGLEHPETLNTLNNLALVLVDLGEDQEALQLFEQISEIRKRNFGSEHVSTLAALSNLANAYQHDNRMAEAMELMESIFESRQKLLGENNPITLTTAINLARIKAASGEVSIAIELLENAQGPLESQLGPDHPDALTALNILATLYHRIGEPRKAVSLMEKVAASRTRTLGENHLSTLISYNNIGRVYEDLGEMPQALESFERAGNGAVTVETSLETLMLLLGNAIRVHDLVSRWDKSEAWHRRLVEATKQQAGESSAAYRQELAHLALNLRQQQKWKEVEPVSRETLRLHEEAGLSDWQVDALRMLLGGALVENQKYEEAEKLLLTAHQGLSDFIQLHPEQASEDLFLRQAKSEAAMRLYELYSKIGKLEEAIKYQEEF